MLKFFKSKRKETKSTYPPKHATSEYNPDANQTVDNKMQKKLGEKPAQVLNNNQSGINL